MIKATQIDPPACILVFVSVARRAIGILFAIICLAAVAAAAAAQEGAGGPEAYRLQLPETILRGVPFDVSVEAPDRTAGTVTLKVGDESYESALKDDGTATFKNVELGAASGEVTLAVDGGTVPISISGGEVGESRTVDAIPGWLSILPPIIAIGLALITRRVIPSLIAGVWIGSWFAFELTPWGLWIGLLNVVDTWVLRALVPEDGGTGHMSIMLFTMLIGGMVGIIYRNGGTNGIVERLTPWARNHRRGEITAAGVGTAVFFDDYASLLVTGNAVRPMTDRLKISREKLAYYVDTSAAPVATLMLVTTWIGFQIGLISDATGQLEGFSQSP